MEDRLALRLRLFRDSGQAPPQVTRFVEEELTALAAEGHPVTEDTAGLLTSHLVMALTRLLSGEPIEQFRTDEDVAAELVDHRRAVARARAISLRAEKELGAALPDSEINFLAMHLAVLPKDALTRDVP
ncbi:PRD domain-containing protein [Streptomyces ochraceiscleroticus]|uniref:PRD domain-containing protein n=1 Tax=Streptomyces ochraceiscleroticus TaxID=47761 RepID=A0ABW1MDS2_9ACTN|nr:PRD domain-containing protein [Streptomyces ochraceiscleroticus]